MRNREAWGAGSAARGAGGGGGQEAVRAQRLRGRTHLAPAMAHQTPTSGQETRDPQSPPRGCESGLAPAPAPARSTFCRFPTDRKGRDHCIHGLQSRAARGEQPICGWKSVQGMCFQTMLSAAAALSGRDVPLRRGSGLAGPRKGPAEPARRPEPVEAATCCACPGTSF